MVAVPIGLAENQAPPNEDWEKDKGLSAAAGSDGFSGPGTCVGWRAALRRRILTMIRRISTKWVMAVLAVVVLPFLGFAWYVDAFVSQRFADDVVRYHLLGHAAELSDRLDRIVDERRRDATILAQVKDVSLCLADRDRDARIFEFAVASLFDQAVASSGSAQFIIAIDENGRVLASNRKDSAGRPLDSWTIDAIQRRKWAEEPWFKETMEHGVASIDAFRSGLTHPDADVTLDKRFHFGFAARVDGQRGGLEPMVPVGMVLTLVPWSLIQGEISDYGVRSRRSDVSDTGSKRLYESSYAWVWADDSDTILAHPRRDLYQTRVSEKPVDLEDMVFAARKSDWGMYPDYSFGGVEKRAAFRHGKPREEGGFGWVVGVSVDYPDIYGPIHEITMTIAKATALVLALAVAVTIFVARRTTRPVQDLEAFTRRVASGDLDAQVPVHGHDELSDLARSFNRMTHQLKENRAQLVKAEKDAAWREMARQVAHEIKNPLTPIQLSASLLKRAHDDESPEFPAILERTIAVIHRQVRNMRDIAKDFYRFAGEHRAPVPVDAGKVLDEVFELNEAWALSEGIQLVRVASASDPAAIVEADPDELQRALVNLVSNAIEAIEGGGTIHGSVEVVADFVEIVIRDTGNGIPAEVLERLFEPYFTTRSSGTGLGLAIVRRIVEDRGGEVTLANAQDGPPSADPESPAPLIGAVATIRLRLRVPDSETT